MLKMLTLFQGLPGQQLVPGVLDHLESPRKEPSTSEAESEASMSEASSEDLVSPLEAEAAPERGEEEASKKKKKAKGLANMFSVFTKGRRKKGQPSSAEPEGELQAPPGPGAPLPTGRLEPHVGPGAPSELARACSFRDTERAGMMGLGESPLLAPPSFYLILGAGSR